MSWKLPKKFKDKHLSPLTDSFRRSSSTSTIVGDGSKQSSVAGNSISSDSNDRGGIPTTESKPSTPAAPPRPGILIVTIHEGRDLSLPPGAEAAFGNASHNQGAQSITGGFQLGSSARPNSSRNQASMDSSHAGSGRPFSSSGAINLVPTNHGRYSQKHLPYALVDFDKQQVFINAVSGSPQEPVWAGLNTQYKFDVSRATEISLSFYVRNPKAPLNAGRNDDIFIGTCKIMPMFEEAHPYIEDPKMSKKDKAKAAFAHSQQEKTLGQIGAKWIDLRYGTGAVKIGVEFVGNHQKSLKIEDFDLLKVIGRGSFGKVMQVRKRDTCRIYAMKTIRKAHIISRSEVEHTLAERSVLAQINNPFIVPLKFSFQSKEKLYLVLAFVNGGELFHHLQREQHFDINRSRFYAAELLCALECLHGFNVIYRDLKPENILLDYAGHIALCDFGLCKLDMKDGDRTNTFCGTPEYLAPELLTGSGYTKAVDWWTLGVLLFEMLTGLPPFYDENTNDMYRKILTEPLHFPGPEIVPLVARDLLTKLLDRNAEKRLGANGAAEIKSHMFFHSIDWRKLLDRKYEPSFKPNVLDQLDTTNFDSEFTSQCPDDSYRGDSGLSGTVQDQFFGWSYNRPVTGLGDAGGSVKDPSFGGVAG